MGQSLSADKSPQLHLETAAVNVRQRRTYMPLVVFKGVEVPFCEKVYQYENYKKLEVTYKFFPEVFVHLELGKDRPRHEPSCNLTLANQLVYGYKFKKNEKVEKIRPDKIFFRRKIYIPISSESKISGRFRQKIKNGLNSRSKGRQEQKRKESKSKSELPPKDSEHKKTPQANKEELLRKLAELKLMSKLEVGSKIGRMTDGSDGILTDTYIQFYSEVPIEKGSFEHRQPGERDKLCETLKRLGFKVIPSSLQMAYSVFQKGYILRQTKRGVVQQTGQTRSIKYMVRQFEDQINKSIAKLDSITNMLSAIQNHLNQRDIDRAMQKFEENMSVLDDNERILYAEQMAAILGKYSYFRNYEREVSSYISSSRSSLAESRNLSISKFNDKRSPRPEHPEESSEDNFKHSFYVDFDSRTPTSPVSVSPRSTAPLRFSDVDLNKVFASNSPDTEYSSNESPVRDKGSSWESNFMMWGSALERLKNAILDNDKCSTNQSLTCLKNLGLLSPLEIEVQYGQLLMENAKTRHAKLIFERLLYTKKGTGSDFVCSEIYCMLGYLAHSKGLEKEALCHYEKALNLRLRLRNYSRRTVLIFNNMAVLEYCLERYERSLLYLHRGMRLGEYCPDYQLLMRSNCAMALAEQGQIKEAKMEMYKTYRNVQPNANMEIVCKFFSNLAYFDLLDGVLDKARINFDSAVAIEEKCLLNNGYRPSLFLHNNFAMYHHKKGEWRKSASHLEKIEGQLGQLSGMLAIQLHFNFGKVYKELYNHDAAVKHFCECRHFLMKINDKNVPKYKEKIESEIEKIEALRIDEVSQESSYANKLSKISRSLLSNKHIDAKMPN